MSQSLSRRSFLKCAGSGAVSLAAALLTGVSAAAAQPRVMGQPALLDGKAAELEVSIDDENEGAAYLCAGTITSNYRIDAVTATIQNADGSELWSQTLFTGIGKWESVESDMLLRETIKTFRMADFAQSLTTAMLEHGNSYHYTINVLLSDGQTYPVKSFDFSV